jgi:hypothetical protein
MTDPVAHGIDARTLDAAPMPGDWQEFGWGDRDEPGPQTENSIERGFRHQEPVDNELGHSDSFDPDEVGDIADEGPGHRG